MSQPAETEDNNRSAGWMKIWDRKYSATTGTTDPHVLDGFDRMTPAEWTKTVNFFIPFLDLQPQHDLVEVGCGAGAFLRELPVCKSVSGCDYSASAIEHAAHFVKGDFRAAEAAHTTFADSSFDRVLSFGVTLYYSNLSYLEQTLAEMWRIARPGALLFVGDISNEKHQTEMEAYRNQHLDQRKTQFLSKDDIDHLYVPKQLFLDFAKSKGVDCEFIDQCTPELAHYYNSAYRYSVIFRKP